MDDEQLLKIYEAHIARGASEEEAMRAVDLAASGTREAQSTPELEAQRRLSGQGGNAGTDFGRMVAQGATFGFGDELAGLLGGDIGKSRQRVDDLRKLAPGASTMAEIAGGVALPTFAGGEAMRAGGGVLRSAAAGALGGAVQGGLTGAGEATGSLAERLPSAEKGAAYGAAGGAVLGAAPSVANAMFKGGKGVPARLSDLLRKTTGVEDDLSQAVSKAQLKEAVAGAELGALDAANPSISDPRVLDALQSNRYVKKAVKAVEPGGFGSEAVANLTMPPLTTPEERAAIELQRRLAKIRESGQPMDAENIGTMFKDLLEADPLSKLPPTPAAVPTGGGKAPSLEQIRTVRQELKDAAERAARKPRTTLAKGYRGARGELTSAVEEAVPGFKDANRKYAQSQSLLEGLGYKTEQGAAVPARGAQRLASKTADQGKLALEGQFPEMQQGMRTRFVNDITSGMGEGGGSWLKNMIERQPETLAKLRNAFPDDDAGSAAFRKLVSELALEQSAARTRAFGKGAGKVGAVVGGGTAGIYGLRALLGGGSNNRP